MHVCFSVYTPFVRSQGRDAFGVVLHVFCACNPNVDMIYRAGIHVNHTCMPKLTGNSLAQCFVGEESAFFCCRKKKKKRAWPLRYCSNCSWAFCYDWNCGRKRCHCLTWLSCYFRRPSCFHSSCSRAFCYDWNCGKKGCCCCYSAVYASLSLYQYSSLSHLI